MAFSQYSKNRHDLDTLRLGKEKKKKKIRKGHQWRLYIQTKKTSSIKNSRAFGMKRSIVRGNSRKVSWGKIIKGLKNYATE